MVANPGKMTLLEMTQDILRSLGSDEVNSIGDTVDSQDVAGEIKATFYEVYSALREPHRRDTYQLESLSDLTKPNYLRMPEEATSIETLYYNYVEKNTLDYRQITYLSPEEFIRWVLSHNTGDTVITSVTDFNGVILPIVNNKNPRYYTSFDEDYLVFDSYDDDVDDTLQQSKNFVVGYKMPQFSMTDSFIPDLPAEQFPHLLSEAKSSCFVNIKQTANPVEAQRARRQRVRLQNDRYRVRKNRDRNSAPFIGTRNG